MSINVSLVMFKADGSRREFPLKKEVTIVGRHNSCGLRVPLTSISRKHCKITIANDLVRLDDLKSSNGTYCNNKRIEKVSLKPSDRIRVGPVIFTVVINGEPSMQSPSETVMQHAIKVASSETSDSDEVALGVSQVSIIPEPKMPANKLKPAVREQKPPVAEPEEEYEYVDADEEEDGEYEYEYEYVDEDGNPVEGDVSELAAQVAELSSDPPPKTKAKEPTVGEPIEDCDEVGTIEPEQYSPTVDYDDAEMSKPSKKTSAKKSVSKSAKSDKLRTSKKSKEKAKPASVDDSDEHLKLADDDLEEVVNLKSSGDAMLDLGEGTVLSEKKVSHAQEDKDLKELESLDSQAEKALEEFAALADDDIDVTDDEKSGVIDVQGLDDTVSEGDDGQVVEFPLVEDNPQDLIDPVAALQSMIDDADDVVVEDIDFSFVDDQEDSEDLSAG